MADFEAVIRRTIDGLSENTPQVRAKVYGKARGAVRRQLESMTPRPHDEMIRLQLEYLEASILIVESEHLTGPRQVRSRALPEALDMQNVPSSRLLRFLLPPAIAIDFFGNLSEIYKANWLPTHGERQAKRRWHRECIGMVGRYWVQSLVATARRLRRLR